MFFVSFTGAFFSLFLILLISFYKQVLLSSLFFLDPYMYSFRTRRMWFWIKDWQSVSRKPKMAAYGVSGRRVILSFNFNSIFFQSHCVIVQSQNCDIFTKRITEGARCCCRKSKDQKLFIQIKNIV